MGTSTWVSAVFLLLAQDAAPQEPPTREDPATWSVGGVLATDVAVLVTDSAGKDALPDEGITGEYTVGGDLHLGRQLSISLQVCVGCHGFEMKGAYADVELFKGLSLRGGRLPVPFGGFSRRTSPAEVESSSKPAPYLMGHMVREDEFNLGIVPAPLVDNGVSLFGNAWLGESVQIGYEAAVVRGLKGFTTDIDFDLSRDFEDNNGEVAGAARLTLTAGPVTVGGSAMAGHYDFDGDLLYQMYSAELHVRAGPLNIRLEGLVRDTEFLVTPTGPEDNSQRLGYVAQADLELDPQWRVFVLTDGLTVEDLFLTPAGPSPVPVAGSTDDRNSLARIVGGVVWAFRPGVLFKGSAEFWDFSDFDDAWVFHLSMVVSF